VCWKSTHDSEELFAYIFRVEEYTKQETSITHIRFFASLILQPGRWSRHFVAKRRLIFSRPHRSENLQSGLKVASPVRTAGPDNGRVFQLIEHGSEAGCWNVSISFCCLHTSAYLLHLLFGLGSALQTLRSEIWIHVPDATVANPDWISKLETTQFHFSFIPFHDQNVLFITFH
jgi:hypothetical protein